VSRGPVTTIDRRYRAPEGAPHVLSEHAASLAVSRNRRGVIASECPRRLPVAAQACSRPTRHPVQTPARDTQGRPPPHCGPVLGRGGIAAASTPLCPQLDVAGTLSEGRLDDSAIPTANRRAPTECPGNHLFSPAMTADRGKRLAIHRGRASASSHRGRASARYLRWPSADCSRPTSRVAWTPGSNRRNQGSAMPNRRAPE
jgi:hypothetical protein